MSQSLSSNYCINTNVTNHTNWGNLSHEVMIRSFKSPAKDPSAHCIPTNQRTQPANITRDPRTLSSVNHTSHFVERNRSRTWKNVTFGFLLFLPMLTSLMPSSVTASRAMVMFSSSWCWFCGRLLCLGRVAMILVWGLSRFNDK